MVMGKWTNKGIQSLERSAVRRAGLGLLSFKCSHLRGYWRQSGRFRSHFIARPRYQERKPIAYISRSLTSTERRYSQIEREVLGCVWAVERLHNYLFGIKFTLLTDNKPLSTMLDPHSSKVLPPRIQRLAWRLHQYSFHIQHIQQIRRRDCHPSKMIFRTLVSFAKTIYDLFTAQICQIFKLSLFLTWDSKPAKMSRCPNCLLKFKAENGRMAWNHTAEWKKNCPFLKE